MDQNAQDRGITSRRQPRDSVLVQATMRRTADGEAVTLRVRNLSAGGLMADAVAEVEPGTAVILEVRGIGTVSGRINWINPPRMGIQFDEQVDPKAARRPVGTRRADPVLLRIPVTAPRPALKVR